MPLVPSRGTTPRPPGLHRGHIIDTPATSADPVRVVIPEFGTQFWGPMGWTPRIDSAGRMVLPAAGVPCIVALDGRRQPLGVMAWGDGTEAAPAPPTPPPTIEAPIVTSLPGSPVAGQVCRYRHTAGQAPWLCIWDPALNGGIGAWAVIGGAPLRGFAGGTNSTTSTSYVGITGGPNVSIPCGGVYDVSIGADARPADGTHMAVMSIMGPGVGAGSEPILVNGQSASTGIPPRVSLAASKRVTFTAGGVVDTRYQINTAGGTATFIRRRLIVTPIELRP